MKTKNENQIRISSFWKYFYGVLFFILASVSGFAQRMENTEKQPATTEFNYDSRDAAWYTQPWIWAIVAAIVILIIAYASKGYLKRHMEEDSESGTTH